MNVYYSKYCSTDSGRKVCQHSVSVKRTSCKQLLTVPAPEQQQSYYRDAVWGIQAAGCIVIPATLSRARRKQTDHTHKRCTAAFSNIAHLNVIPMTLHQPLGCQKLGPSDFVVQGCHLPWDFSQLCSQLAREIFNNCIRQRKDKKKKER